MAGSSGSSAMRSSLFSLCASRRRASSQRLRGLSCIAHPLRVRGDRRRPQSTKASTRDTSQRRREHAHDGRVVNQAVGDGRQTEHHAKARRRQERKHLGRVLGVEPLAHHLLARRLANRPAPPASHCARRHREERRVKRNGEPAKHVRPEACALRRLAAGYARVVAIHNIHALGASPRASAPCDLRTAQRSRREAARQP